MKTPHALIDRISPQYLALQRELHARPEGYGGKGYKWAPPVVELIQRYDARSVLDYGAGEGRLVRALREAFPAGMRFDEYDPAMPGLEQLPSFADLVVSTDVLEHIEPDKLAAVLAHIRMLARKAVFFVIALEAANKTLADGRNAHLIQQPRDWWQERLVTAGFRTDSADDLPFHRKYRPDAQAKRWITVAEPC